MSGAIIFDFPRAWLLALPLAAALAFAIWRQRRGGLKRSRILAVGALRAFALLALVFLAARPIWMSREPPAAATRSVMVLMDRSESMSLEERDATRYQQALDFLRERLLPALQAASLPVQAMLFDQSAEPADGAKLAAATPNGKRTNLGGAVAQALGQCRPATAGRDRVDGRHRERERGQHPRADGAGGRARAVHRRGLWQRPGGADAFLARGGGAFDCLRRRPPSALRRSLK
jgi:hypothetical protein